VNHLKNDTQLDVVREFLDLYIWKGWRMVQLGVWFAINRNTRAIKAIKIIYRQPDQINALSLRKHK